MWLLIISNLKDLFVKKKSGLWKKNWSYRSKNYFFEKPLKNACRNMCHILIFVEKKIFSFLWPFLGIFFPPSLAPKLLKLSVYFFLRSGHEKLDNEHAFQPHIYSLRSFSKGGGRQTPPRLYIDSGPPVFIGLMYSFFIKNIQFKNYNLSFAFALIL